MAANVTQARLKQARAELRDHVLQDLVAVGLLLKSAPLQSGPTAEVVGEAIRRIERDIERVRGMLTALERREPSRRCVPQRSAA